MCAPRSTILETLFPSTVLLMTSITPWVNRIYNSSFDRSLTLTVLTGATIINCREQLQRQHRENANIHHEVRLRNQLFAKADNPLKQTVYARDHFKQLCPYAK